MSWSDGQVADFVRRLKKTWGPCWHVLVPELRSAIVDSFVLGIVVAQDRETVVVADVRKLSASLHAEMGHTMLGWLSD